MSRVRPLEIIRQFYSTNLEYIPLIKDTEGELCGYLSRDRLNRQMSDLDRAEEAYDTIPDSWIESDVSREALMRLTALCPVPVLNLAGQQKETWSDTELLKQASLLREKERARSGEQADDNAVLNAAPESSDQWFARLVLAAIPHPILATDLNGHSLFYNEGFSSRVLRRDMFHNNLALAESYFLELTRGLLTKIYSEGPHPADLLFASIPELSISVEITTIHREDQVSGYLYIFQDPELSGIPHEVLSRLERGMSLDEIMEELEAGIIASMLRRNGQNVSHAAQALRTNRSTLQNKIKRLKVNERFGRRVEGPVRRVRQPGKTDDASSGNGQDPKADSSDLIAGKDSRHRHKDSAGGSDAAIPPEASSVSREGQKAESGSSAPGKKKRSSSPGKKASSGSKPVRKAKAGAARSKKAQKDQKESNRKKTLSSDNKSGSGRSKKSGARPEKSVGTSGKTGSKKKSNNGRP